MIATDILMAEHRVIERVINSIDAYTIKLENNQEVHPEFYFEVADFIRGFADGCHHKKEEEVLFRTLEQTGGQSATGDISTLLDDHAKGREYTRQMRSAAEALKQGDENARTVLISSARSYTQLLRDHIKHEDHILFPIAEQVLSQEQKDSIAVGFEYVEHEETGEGVHEKFLALAEKLEQEALAD